MKLEIPRAVAATVADRISSALVADGCCWRAVAAGSIRRQKPVVGDIEVVAELSGDFGASARVGKVISDLGIQHGLPASNGNRAPWGPRYYRALVPANGGDLKLPLDLFVVFPPATWAVVYLIRTGSAEFSQSFVTRLRTFGLRSEAGRILRGDGGEDVPVPDETALFDLCRLPWIEPRDRDLKIEHTRALFKRSGP